MESLHGELSKHQPIGAARIHAPGTQFPQEEADRRDNAIQQIMGIGNSTHAIIYGSWQQAETRLIAPDAKPANMAWDVLDVLASVAIAGIAGGVAVSLVASIGKVYVKKFAEDAIKEGIKSVGKTGREAFQSGGASDGKSSYETAKRNFGDAINGQLTQLRTIMGATLASHLSALRTFETSELERLSNGATSLADKTKQLMVTGVQHFLVMWTNFLARAHHGGMTDLQLLSEGSNAIPLRGASDPTIEDVAQSNIDPGGLWNALDPVKTLDEELTGILEINLDPNGNLVPENGMVLRGVGALVVEKLRGLPTVRHLHVNKIIRVANINWSRGPLGPFGTMLITADGNLRRAPGLLRVTGGGCEKGEGVVGKFLPPTCEFSYAYDMANVERYAERAQNFSLLHLEHGGCSRSQLARRFSPQSLLLLDLEHTRGSPSFCRSSR